MMSELKKGIRRILKEHSSFKQVIDDGLVTKKFDELIDEAKQELLRDSGIVYPDFLLIRKDKFEKWFGDQQ